MATLSELQTELAEYKAARTAILTGAQEYSTRAGGTVKRGDLATIIKEIKRLESEISNFQNGGSAFVIDISGGGY